MLSSKKNPEGVDTRTIRKAPGLIPNTKWMSQSQMPIGVVWLDTRSDERNAGLDARHKMGAKWEISKIRSCTVGCSKKLNF